jgi:SAM-dependent methyltransferase
VTPAEFTAPVRAARAADAPLYRTVVARAAARFRPLGRHAYYFARGKLGADPVFAALLRDGRIAAGARIVDIGCGVGVLAALLAAAEQFDGSAWPAGWAPPPQRWTLRGLDLRARAIDTARRALADLRGRASFKVGDARSVALPPCDLVVLLDVLHYVDQESQEKLLGRVRAALGPGGTLLIRVADAAPNWRFRFTLALDWIVTFGRGTPWPRLHCRPLAEWVRLLEAWGFSVATQPMSEGTPFANALLIATRDAASR